MKLHPLAIDNFAGGGGASTGIEAALGRAIDAAINHDAEAVAMHLANHPGTRHYRQSIYAVDPLVVVEDALARMGGSINASVAYLIDLIWFSPDCKHHSKAKGGKPREKNIRDLAWVVVHWIERLQAAYARAGKDARRVIRCIMLENVEEFRKWGPLDANGFPIKEQEGEEFDKFVRAIKRLGGRVEFRELVACDYGAKTSRKRLYMIVRFDDEPIVWPEPTHGKPGSPEVESGQRLPWPTAAECIDWSIPCPSIFERQRQLKDATKRRIAHGTMRYVVNAARPFVVPLTHHGSIRVHDIEEPFKTITGAHRGELAAVDAALVPHVTKFRGGAVGSDAGNPMPTVTANGNPARPAGAQPLALASASIVGLGGRRAQSAPLPVDRPYPTTTAKADAAIAAVHMEKLSENSRGRPASVPLDTVMAGAARHAQVVTFLSQFRGSNRTASGGHPGEPAKAVTAGGLHQAVVCAHMEQANTGMVGHEMRRPVSTIVSKGCTQRLVETTLLEEGDLPPEMMERATRVAAFLIKYYGAGDGQSQAADKPLDTVTTLARFAVVTVTIDATTYVIVDIGMRMLTPRELARAQGFPDSYILDPIGPNGRPLSKAAQIRMIGNSVCPDVAAALVRANLPRHAGEQEAIAA